MDRTNPADELIGQMLGKFKILEEIGRTAMSTVYKAWFASLEVYVALKVLAPHLATKPTAVRRFHQEARRAASLQHPNIIHIYDVGTESGQHYFAMKYVEGQSLKEKLRSAGRPLNIRDALAVFHQVAAALEHAHGEGIIHLDINPNNVLLDVSGAVYLSDFGISQSPKESDDSTPAVPVGTPGYSSPEQVLAQNVDARSDIFSLGILLYQMVSGQPPFISETTVGYAWRIVHQEPRPLREINPRVPVSLEKAILKALSKDPKQRYQHVAEMIRDVERAQPTTKLLGRLSNGMRAGSSDLSALSPRWRNVLAVAGGMGTGLLILLCAAILVLQRPGIMPPLVAQSSVTPTLTLAPTSTSAGGETGPTTDAATPVSTLNSGPPPATPAVGGRIAFVSNRDGNNEIYVMNADGSGVKRLTINQADDASPSWSPDGTAIVFVSNRDSNYEVYVMNDDGADVTRLTNSQSADWGASWSPGGSRIAFVSDRDGDDDIYVTSLDGTGERNLTGNTADDWWPCWSPDGKRIAFVSDRDGGSEIYAMDADGSNVDRLTNDSGFDLSWSPDGIHIAFVSERDGNWEVYVMNADGSGQRNLTNNPAQDWWPWWSPDGGQTLFVSDRDGDHDIYVTNADGGDVTHLTNNTDWDACPCWSPN
jgi:serine/threonine protein kinase